MPERGETFLHPTPRHQSLDPHETKRTKPPEDNSAQERGETFFQKKYKISARCLVSKQIIYRGSTKKETPFYHKLPPGNDSLGTGGKVFPRNTTLTSVASDDNNLLLKGHVRHPTKADQFLPKGTCPCKKQPSKRYHSPTLPNKPPRGIYQKGGKCFS